MTFPLMPPQMPLRYVDGWTYVGTTNIDTTAVLTPAATQVGDLIVFFDDACASAAIPAVVVPAGYTQLAANTWNYGSANTNRYQRTVISYKIATENGAKSISPVVAATGAQQRMVMVFRPATPISTVEIAEVLVDPGVINDASDEITLTAPLGGYYGVPLILYHARRWTTAPTITSTPVGVVTVLGGGAFQYAFYRFGFDGPNQTLEFSAGSMVSMEGFYLLGRE